VQLNDAVEELHKTEDARLERVVAFRGDEQGLPRDRLRFILAVMRRPPKVPAHLDLDKWMDVFRSQPWLAQQDVEEAKRKEIFEGKTRRLAEMAGIVEQKREDLAKDSARLEALESAMERAEKVCADEQQNASDRDKDDARHYVETKRGTLEEARADHRRRREALDKLEHALADFTKELAEEEREAKERLEAAREAKAEFERREGAEEDRRASQLQARKKALLLEMGTVDRDLARAEDEGADDDELDALEDSKQALEDELTNIDRELHSMRERADRRALLALAAADEARAEAELIEKKELQIRLREDKKAEIVDQMRAKAEAEDEERAKAEAIAQVEREKEAELQAASGLARMGLLDPSLKKHKTGPKAAFTSLKKATSLAIYGVEDKKAEQQETNNMMQSIMRRQKMKMGACTALRKFKFTVGKDETDLFAERQTELSDNSLPHFVRVKKTVGLHDQIVIWFEQSMDQDEFITDVIIAHPSEDHPSYMDLSSKGYTPYSHPKLNSDKGSDPGFVIWARKRKDAVYVVSSLEVSYSAKDEQNLEADGYERLPENLTTFNFGDMYVWVKKINRNAETAVENEETIIQELRAARKELRKRQDDPILIDRVKGLRLRLEKVKEQSDFRDAYKDDPLKFAIEFMAITQREVEGWMEHFEKMDTEAIGAVTSTQVLDYLGFRQTKFMHAAFLLLGEPHDGSRMDFGETVKCIGQFCFFGKDELLHFAYSIFDNDDNGWISHEEFLLLLSDLHSSTNRGRTTRALREIDLLDDGKLEYHEFLTVNRRFPNLFYPLFESQGLMRQKFFGTRHWIRKLAKYQKIKAELREERKNNTDKMEAAVAWGERRREVRNERLRKKRLAAQNTQSILKRSILSAQIYALSWAAKHDKKEKQKAGKINKNLMK